LVDEDDSPGASRGRPATVGDTGSPDKADPRPPAEETAAATPTTMGGVGAAIAVALPAADRIPAGATVGRYEIVKTLGQGGMGIVYLAYDPTLDRPVALKLLRPELRGAQARLLREGQSVARLAHPNVVRVFDVGTDHDDLFIAMEYVDGATLGRWLRAERRQPRAIFELFAAAGRGLAAAHAAGLVHRDFKPDNVLVGRDGRVVVTDFGLARLDADEALAADADPDAARAPAKPWLTVTLTRTGSLMGTPAYMSPEQLRGEVADARSDQFGFCVAHWEALFGQRPFALPERASLDEVRDAVDLGVVAPATPTPKALGPAERALRRGLSLDPADRFPDMDALLAALEPPRTREAMVALAAGHEKIAHFRVIERIGQGGMGIVYRARDEKLGRDVALKVLPGDVVARADRRERFLREARAAAAVVHPAIATVFEVGTDGDVPYIAMEYVAGRTLREVLVGGPLAVAELIRIATPIADALSRAHRAGVVHRDLKPENVMLDADGVPKILDFGLARVFDPTTSSQPAPDAAILSVVTEEGTILGTPAYMSPEQARGRAVDHRSDLFSFGTLVFELLTAQAPFRGPSTMDIATAIIRDNPPAPSSITPAVPHELDRIVLKCLEKDPEDRYQSAGELVVDLRRLLRQTESGFAHNLSGIAMPRKRARARWIVPVVLVAVVGSATGVWLATRGGGDGGAARVVTPPPDAAPARWSERRLTAASSRGTPAGRLSPDGTTLAIAGDARLTVQDVATGRSRDVLPLPSGPDWLVWFPDGERLLFALRSGTGRPDLQIASTTGGAPRSLTIHPRSAVVAGDGQHLASLDDGGIRITDLDGNAPRLVVGIREQADLGRPAWSPDDRWLVYSLRGPGLHPALRAVSADGSSDVVVVEDAAMAADNGPPSYTWSGDGLILYNTYPESGGTRLMAIDFDRATGRPRGAPIELERYADLAGIDNTSRDGRAILYSRYQRVATRFHATLDARGITSEAPVPRQDWSFIARTRDGKASFYSTWRLQGTADHTELLTIGDDGVPHLLASFEGIIVDPQLLPDESGVIYLRPDATKHRIALERVAVSGGTPAEIAPLPYQPSDPIFYTRMLVAQLVCAHLETGGCVLGATEGQEQAFYVIDPVRGRGRRIAGLRGATPWTWDLSPDGVRIVAGRTEGDLSIIDVESGAIHRSASPGIALSEIRWIGTTGAMLAMGVGATNMQLVRIARDGKTTRLRENLNEGVQNLVVAPSGREIYFRTVTWSREFWLRTRPSP
jgi:serine/threonine protein kinase